MMVRDMIVLILLVKKQALINGTLREDDFCQVCGEKGHRQFECPHRAKTFKAAGVVCSICGDMSHPTRDCPLKQDAPTNEIALDSEYMSFMSELGGKNSGGPRAGDGNGGAACGDCSDPAAPPSTMVGSIPVLAPKDNGSMNISSKPQKQQTIVSVTYTNAMFLQPPAAAAAPLAPSYSGLPVPQTYPAAPVPAAPQQYWNPMPGQMMPGQMQGQMLYPPVYPPVYPPQMGYPQQGYAPYGYVAPQYGVAPPTWDPNMQQQMQYPPPSG